MIALLLLRYGAEISAVSYVELCVNLIIHCQLMLLARISQGNFLFNQKFWNFLNRGQMVCKFFWKASKKLNIYMHYVNQPETGNFVKLQEEHQVEPNFPFRIFFNIYTS